MSRIVIHLCMLVLLLLPTLCPAGDTKPKRDDAAIEKVVAASIEAGAKQDWSEYANLVHPDSLDDYKNMWLPLLRAPSKEGGDKHADLLSLFDKAADLKSVIDLQPKEFFASSMKGMASQFREPKAMPLNVDAKIIGTVREGDEAAYVVVRTRTKNQGTEMTKVDVITLKRTGAEWKLMLPDVVRVMADTFKRTLQDGKPAEKRDGTDD